MIICQIKDDTMKTKGNKPISSGGCGAPLCKVMLVIMHLHLENCSLHPNLLTELLSDTFLLLLNLPPNLFSKKPTSSPSVLE